MLKITVYYADRLSFSHFADHIIAVIEDEEKKREFIIDHRSYDAKKVYKDNKIYYVTKRADGEERFFRPYARKSVVLTSDKNMGEFIKLYSEKFSIQSYNLFKRNCADAINFTLDYFCPGKNIELNSTALKVICFLPSIVLIGAKWFPTPGGLVTTPAEVFAKAEQLGDLGYGEPADCERRRQDRLAFD